MRPTLSRATHDRAAHHRADEAWLAAAWPRAQVLAVTPDGFAPIRHEAAGTVLDLVPGADVDPDLPRAFLGQEGDVAFFSVPGEKGAGWESLRAVAAALTDREAGLLASAVALAAWHDTHRCCPRCGAPTVPASGGWSTRCTVDASLHFPRTDPAVIMLVHDGAERCVLGRGTGWAPGRFSILAGFVEAGESAEAAVAREVEEEVGLLVRDIEYVASQPWPFPASLMLGYTALADPAGEMRLADGELAEAGWFTRAEVREARRWGEEGAEPVNVSGPLRALPPSASISSALITDWLDAG
jgi:NAD+ diphosphatase